MNHDRYPRVPRRREQIAAGIFNWAVCIAACVGIGWLAAQGF